MQMMMELQLQYLTQHNFKLTRFCGCPMIQPQSIKEDIMPLKSKVQARKFGAMLKSGEISKATFDKWMKHTSNIKKLPERVKKKKK